MDKEYFKAIRHRGAFIINIFFSLLWHFYYSVPGTLFQVLRRAYFHLPNDSPIPHSLIEHATPTGSLRMPLQRTFSASKVLYAKPH